MEQKTLIQYGALNLSKSYIITSDVTGERGHSHTVQRLTNTRTPGSTPVSRNLQEKTINLAGSIIANSVKTVEDIINEVNAALSDGDRYYRSLRQWSLLLEPASTYSWTPGGDGTAAALDTSEAWFETSLKFDVDVSLSADDYVEYSTDDGIGTNLESYEGTGNFEIGIYIPDPTYITSVSFRVGSDISNYLSSGDLTTQFDGQPIKQGWNWFSIGWDTMVMTGTIDPGLIGRYLYFKMAYTSAQADINNVRFAGMIWQNDEITKNYRCYSSKIDPEDQHFQKSFTNFNLDLLAYKGYGESTTEKIAYSGVGSTNPASISMDLSGNESPEPVIALKMTNVTNLDTVTLQNNTTGDQVIIDPTSWTANDNINIDTESKAVTQNNSALDYTSVLPRFVVGKNKLSFSLTSSSQDTQQQATNNTDLSGEI